MIYWKKNPWPPVYKYYICTKKKTRWRYFKKCTANPPDFLKRSSFVTLITVELKSAAFPPAGPLLLLLPGRDGPLVCTAEKLSSKRVMSALVVFLSWPSLLCQCWSLSYSLSSATVGPFGICAGLVLLGEPDQSWPDVNHIWMCSTYILARVPFFFCLGYANLYANTAGQRSPI